MNKTIKKTGLVAAVLLGAVAIPQTIEATSSDFNFSDLGSGYELRANLMKKNVRANVIPFFGQENIANLELTCGEGKCGEGKCGTDTSKVKKQEPNKKVMKNDKKKGKVNENKCGEGKCGSN